MPGISIHVVDVSRGIVASGMRVSVWALSDTGTRRSIAIGTIGRNGLLADTALDQLLPAGRYQAVFEVADYYRASGVALPDIPFLNEVLYDFGVSEPSSHYHLPFKCTPWGYSCFRGGA